MDPLTHLVSGAAASQCFKDSFPKRAFVALCMLAAALPDVDVLVGSNPVVNLSYRRGITHSLWLVPVWGVVIASLVRRFLNYSWTKSFLVFSGLVALHLYLDLTNSYGTQIFAPFSASRIAYDSVFIIDFFWLGLFVATFLIGRFKGVRPARWAFVLALSYPLLNYGIRRGLEHQIQQTKQASTIRLSSDAFTPFRWKVFDTDEATIRVHSWTLWSGLGPELAGFTRTPDDFFSKRYAEHLMFRVYDWFSVWPVFEKSEEPNSLVRYSVQDLRFYSTLAFVRNRMEHVPFEFEFTEMDSRVTQWKFFSGGSGVHEWNLNPPSDSSGSNP